MTGAWVDGDRRVVAVFLLRPNLRWRVLVPSAVLVSDARGGVMSVEPELPAGADGPVTTTVTRRIKPGHEAAYEGFLAGISGAARAFPGYLGVEVFRPAPGGAAGSTGPCIASTRSSTCMPGWILPSARRGWSAPSPMSPGRCGPRS